MERTLRLALPFLLGAMLVAAPPLAPLPPAPGAGPAQRLAQTGEPPPAPPPAPGPGCERPPTPPPPVSALPPAGGRA